MEGLIILKDKAKDMKTLAVILSILLLSSCGSSFIYNDRDCDLYDKYDANPWNSLIAEKIENPCRALRLITVAAKSPALFDDDYVEKFNEWSTKVEEFVQGNVTYSDFQDLILVEVAKLNRRVGGVFLIISSDIFLFDEQGLFLPKDVELVLALIDYLQEEVSELSLY